MSAGIYYKSLAQTIECDSVQFGYANNERIANILLRGQVLYTIPVDDLLYVTIA